MFGRKVDLKSIEAATKVEQARTTVYRFKSELAELNNAAPPEKAITAALDAALDRLADRGREALPVRGLVAPAGAPNWKPELSDADLLGLVVAVARDQVRALVIEKAEVALGSRKSLSPAERAKKVEAVKAKLLAAELEEESLIRAADDGGIEVLRRADADPRATLGA
ncbi:hypothetical protein BMI86_00065 [Thioclava sp. DLFJ5-1]|uniref:hypothetical protein n=1 Tax=Thioclava sp. DLFJ5-1 TaxID=1915314 RepID=UPI0009971E5B|nr:hypothetical protein [Thioclava sp. DLFJ5-1]OOY21030.1 hypothetical protein BMI86_00065 [Thioclava sp. DLFJ5-1]